MEYRQALSTGVVLAEQYRIDTVLGAGGFGITYLAEDLGLRSIVVVKEYFPGQLAVRDGGATVQPRSPQDHDFYAFGCERFLQEARILDQCRHPNIVRVRRVIEVNNTAYMALDFVAGVSLDRWLIDLRRRPTQAEIDAIMAPLLDALAYIHALPQPVVHRDISPDNIMISDGGAPVLIDFGAARVEIAGRTASRAGAYKLNYSPPEQQAQRSDWQGAWTDIYAFAATLRRAVTGRPPMDCLERQIDDAMPKVAAMPLDGYRASFLAALDHGMALRHQDRPQSITAWRDALLGRSTPTRSPTLPLKPTSPPTAQLHRPWTAAVAKLDPMVWKSAAGLAVGAAILWGALHLGHRGGDAVAAVGPVAPKTIAAAEAAIPNAAAPSPVAPTVNLPSALLNLPISVSPAGGVRITRREPQPTTPATQIASADPLVSPPSVPAPPPVVDQLLKPKAVFQDCAGCPAMVVVPAGQFKMGSNENGNERPSRQVTIRRPFAVSKFEVTFDDWDACVAGGGCASNPRPRDEGWGHGRQPVINVSWSDANEYVAWLSRTTGKTYRLLSEAEWEYAARGGSTTNYPWGNDIGKRHANCDTCATEWDNERPAPVGSFPPNGFGLHDMAGNVAEWVEDALHADYRGAPNDGSVWQGGITTLRTTRGGSWHDDPVFLRSAMRMSTPPSIQSRSLGIRVARVLK